MRPQTNAADDDTTPYAFTEHGVVMAANVLNSPVAVQISVHVVRAFVRLRQALSTSKDLAKKLAPVEKRLDEHDQDIQGLIHALRELLDEPDEPAKPKIGYQSEEQG